jgi:hypothetical protein
MFSELFFFRFPFCTEHEHWARFLNRFQDLNFSSSALAVKNQPYHACKYWYIQGTKTWLWFCVSNNLANVMITFFGDYYFSIFSSKNNVLIIFLPKSFNLCQNRHFFGENIFKNITWAPFFFVVKQLDSVEFTKGICSNQSLKECMSDSGHGFYTWQCETRHRQRKWCQDLHRGELSRRNFKQGIHCPYIARLMILMSKLAYIYSISLLVRIKTLSCWWVFCCGSLFRTGRWWNWVKLWHTWQPLRSTSKSTWKSDARPCAQKTQSHWKVKFFFYFRNQWCCPFLVCHFAEARITQWKDSEQQIV